MRNSTKSCISFTTKIKKWTLHETRFVTQVCILWRNWAVWQVFNCLSKSWAPKCTNPRKPDGHWPISDTGKLMTKGNKTLKRLLYSLKATCWNFISKHENRTWHTGRPNLLMHDVIKQEYICKNIYCICINLERVTHSQLTLWLKLWGTSRCL